MSTVPEIDFDLLNRISQAFSPSAPIDQKALFAGRLRQLSDVMNAINQKGQHAILYGERGVGKTSLATVISRMFHATAITPRAGPINCDSTMDYGSLWRKIFREIVIASTENTVGFTGEQKKTLSTLDQHLNDPITPDDVRYWLSQLGKSLIIIDEVDRLTNPDITRLLADTIKTLSDHAVDATLLLVGVADSVDTLIKEHNSVERAVAQVQMPRMSPDELHEIVDKGLTAVGMTTDIDTKRRIAKLSQGLPHYTHLLALHAAQSAVGGHRRHVELRDVRYAINKAVVQAQQSVKNLHHKAISSPRENLYPQVLLACALAMPDSLGYFAAGDIRDPMSRIMGKPYDIPAFSQHLNAFCDGARGPVLQRTGTARRYRFRFVNPLMQPYVIMVGIEKGLISEADVS